MITSITREDFIESLQQIFRKIKCSLTDLWLREQISAYPHPTSSCVLSHLVNLRWVLFYKALLNR